MTPSCPSRPQPPHPLPAGPDIALVMSGIRQLVADDRDHAAIINGVGFSKTHTSRGRYLAQLPWLSVPEILECAELVYHYRRQMSQDQIAAATRIMQQRINRTAERRTQTND